MPRTTRTNLRWLLKFLALVFTVQIFLPAHLSAQSKLIFAVDLIRHGDRTPLQDLPGVPHEWPEGLGELTATGIHQEFQMGAKMRTFYVEQHHLLPPKYETGTLYVRSTDSDRTLMSAQAFLTGLYPPGTGPSVPGSTQPALPGALQPIPIHTLPSKIDSLLNPATSDDLWIRNVESTTEWKRKTAELKPMFPVWSRAAGVTVTNLGQLNALADALQIDQIYHVPLPQILADDAQKIIEAGRWSLVESYKPAEIGKATGQPLLGAIGDCFQQASEGKTRLKYILFSAHDSTLLAEMSALGAPLTNVPPYGSRLHFSLFQIRQNEFRVEVTYNDQPVMIPAWRGSSASLSQFMALANRR